MQDLTRLGFTIATPTIKKFNVRSGKVKECVHIEAKGHHFFVTPNAGWFVSGATPEGEITDVQDGCSVYEEPVEVSKPTESWTIPELKAYLDEQSIPYTGITLKAELLKLI